MVQFFVDGQYFGSVCPRYPGPGWNIHWQWTNIFPGGGYEGGDTQADSLEKAQAFLEAKASALCFTPWEDGVSW